MSIRPTAKDFQSKPDTAANYDNHHLHTYMKTGGPIPRFSALKKQAVDCNHVTIVISLALSMPKYAVFVDDNFHQGDVSERFLLGEYSTREEALKKMASALDEYIIEGIKTTIPFHQKIMNNKEFKEGTNVDTGFLERIVL